MVLYKNPDFRLLPPTISDIFNRPAEESFFALPQWYDLIARFGVPAGTEIRAYIDERRSSRAALLLQVNHEGSCRSLTSLANAYSVEHGMLGADRSDMAASLETILGEIWAERPRWVCLRLLEFDPADACYPALLRTLRRHGLFVECTPGSATWFECTEQMTFEEYLAQRPSQLRNTWYRKAGRIRDAGRLHRAFFDSLSGLDQAVRDYEAIYAASWKPAEAFPRFIPELIRVAAELGALRMGIYYVDDLPAAAQFWIVWRGRAVIYKLAHDQRFDKLSLGTLLTMEMIERVLAGDRPHEINFGRGDDAYKQLWLPKRRQRWGMIAANPRTLAGVRLGLKREAAKLYHRMRREAIAPPMLARPG